MAEKPKDLILPEPEPHTRIKHAILRKYLKAWFPILANPNGFARVLYIDGFAGTGLYQGGAEGSPIIAIKVALQSQKTINKSVNFIFIENDAGRFELLKQQVAGLKAESPSNFEFFTENEKFANQMPKIIAHYDGQLGGFNAAFTFIDPFGYGGVPLALITEIMRHKSCEVLITFMFQEINRFLGVGESDKARNELFGTEDWKGIVAVKDPKARRTLIHDLYQRQLIQQAGIKYIRSFQMKNSQNSTDLFLFFGTNRPEGLREMKRAMWAADESGSFTFSDTTDPNQLVMLGTFNSEDLKGLLVRRYSGQTVKLAEVNRYVLEETPFRHDAHLKTPVLTPMKKAKELQVVGSDGKEIIVTGFTDDNMLIRFF